MQNALIEITKLALKWSDLRNAKGLEVINYRDGPGLGPTVNEAQQQKSEQHQQPDPEIDEFESCIMFQSAVDIQDQDQSIYQS